MLRGFAMQYDVKTLGKSVMDGQAILFADALSLAQEEDFDALLEASQCVREKYCQNRVTLCSIMNAKSGMCSEDCRFCAQSGHYTTGVQVYPITSFESALRAAVIAESHGIQRFALVTSGKKLNDREFSKILEIIHGLRRTVKIDLCASLGALTRERAEELKEAGITRYHHNVETSSDYFPQICTTHTYLDRIETIRTVIAAGIEPCCGGIIGLGESMEQRIRLAFEIKAMGVKSIPLNILNPIPGTPLEHMPRLAPDEILRTIAMFRLIIPDSELRYAGGRCALGDKQRLGLIAGISSVMVGNFLTTAGNDISQDLAMIKYYSGREEK